MCFAVKGVVCSVFFVLWYSVLVEMKSGREMNGTNGSQIHDTSVGLIRKGAIRKQMMPHQPDAIYGRADSLITKLLG